MHGSWEKNVTLGYCFWILLFFFFFFTSKTFDPLKKNLQISDNIILLEFMELFSTGLCIFLRLNKAFNMYVRSFDFNKNIALLNSH